MLCRETQSIPQSIPRKGGGVLLVKKFSDTWIKSLSSSTGIATLIIEELYRDLITNLSSFNTPIDIVRWYINWLVSRPANIKYFIRMNTLEKEFGNPYENYTLENQLSFISNDLLNLISQWISGEPLIQIEANIPFIKNNSKCERARKFSLKIINNFAL